MTQLKRLIIELTNNTFKINLETYPKWIGLMFGGGWAVTSVGVFLGTLQLCLILIPYLNFGDKELNTQTALLPNTNTDTIATIATIAPLAIGGSELFQFDTGYWKPNKKGGYRVIDNSIYLQNEKNVIFEYSDPVPPQQNFEFEFALEGEKEGNLSFGRSEFYEIVVGDGDYKTVTLKAALNKGGDLKSVEELNFKHFMSDSNLIRPRLTNSELVKGETTLVEIKEEVIEREKKIKVVVTIKEQDFVFVFELVPNWKDLNDFYYGLIDYSEKGDNQTGVYWINPDVVPRINN